MKLNYSLLSIFICILSLYIFGCANGQYTNHKKEINALEKKSINPWTWQDKYGFVQANEVSSVKRTLYTAGIVSVDEDGNTALILAVKLKHSVEIINFLLDHGADIDHKNNEGISSFMFAAIDNNNVLKRLLKERGAVSSNKDLLAARVRYCNDFNYDPELRMQALIGVEARVNFIIQ